jgi:hypothetical protein
MSNERGRRGEIKQKHVLHLAGGHGWQNKPGIMLRAGDCLHENSIIDMLNTGLIIIGDATISAPPLGFGSGTRLLLI